jgi:hypothetical protein
MEDGDMFDPNRRSDEPTPEYQKNDPNARPSSPGGGAQGRGKRPADGQAPAPAGRDFHYVTEWECRAGTKLDRIQRWLRAHGAPRTDEEFRRYDAYVQGGNDQ